MENTNEYYNAKFYEKQWRSSLASAEIILPMVLKVIPEVKSAIDFGCGVGTWLSALQKLGVKEIMGYDGKWVNKKLLQISEEYFTEIELDKKIPINKKYDLAMSLEVAEHLPKEISETFVKSLVEASDVVLFSAAIPYQGGENHINEQRQSYWNALFEKFGYVCIDYLRERIWKDKRVCWWYKQNILLFVNKNILKQLHISEKYFRKKKLNIVHHQLYFALIKRIFKKVFSGLWQ